MRVVLRRQRQGASLALILGLAVFLLSFSAQAGTIVRVSTSLGDYSIELLDEEAPVTVQNFLNYVNRNAFNGTFVHRLVKGFVAQGGGYRFQSFFGPVEVPADPPIVNEFGASNLRGTVAMAKLADDPNSATSQWYVNLSDNVELDTTNGGFTVFGVVLGDGMTILDAMNDLVIVSPGTLFPEVPITGTFYQSPDEFVYINVEVVDRFSSAPHLLETGSGLLITSVDVDDGSELVSMNFNGVPSESGVVIQANLESVITRRETFEGIATYSTTDNRLRIPTLEINDNGTVLIVSNVVFVLSNPELAQFTLESYDQ